MLLEPDYRDVYSIWKTKPGPESNRAMLAKIQPLVDMAVRSYAPAGSPNVRSSARLMALEVLKRYDPKQAKLQSFLMSQLKSLQRMSAQNDQAVHIPERTVLGQRRLNEIFEELTHELGREPTDLEISNKTGITSKMLTKFRGANAGVSESQLSAGLGHIAGAVQLPGQVSDAWRQIVYSDLDPYHRKIMEHTFGMNNHPVLDNNTLAKRLKRSPGAISQAKNRIQQMLDQETDLSPF